MFKYKIANFTSITLILKRSHVIEEMSTCIMENGLIADVEYYKKINEAVFTTGIFTYPKEMLYISGTYRVTVHNELMVHLKEPTAWISTDVMDAFCAVTAEPGVIFVSTTLTALIFNPNCTITADDWVMYKDLKWIENQNPRKMFFPILYSNHWVLFVLDFEQSTAYTLDPKNNIDYSHMTCRLFRKYLQESHKRGPNFINKVNWKFVLFALPRPLQSDTVNCALYVMYYAECMTKCIPFNMNFNPIQYRNYVFEKLIKISTNITSTCQLCFRTNFKKGIPCCYCKRYTHTTCFKKSHNLYKSSLYLKTGFYCFFCVNYVNQLKKD